jgi:serine/threonine protein kinase
MNQSSCPDAKLLALYATNQLDAKRAQSIRVHLATCARCKDAVDGLSPNDGLSPTVAYDSKDDATAKVPEKEKSATKQDEIVDLSVLGQSPKKEALGRMGKYDILEIVGHGGMGVVFRAFDEQLRRTVAIKVLTRALANNATARRRFIREARAAAAINHLNVVTIHSVEEHESLPFLVMEFIRGDSLRDHLRKVGPAEPTDIVRIAAQIASGLAAAHAQGVIHRDIKPGNVMLESGIDRVKITDFGLARVAVDNVDLTARERPVGTPAYMSPEQVTGRKVGSRTDLFSLGCVMYTMAQGKSPFRGESALQVANKVCDYHPPRLSQCNEQMPQFLSEIVDRLLQKEPENRFQSSDEVVEVLQRHLAAINLSRSDELTVTLHNQPSYSPRRRKFKWLAPLVLAVAVAAGLGIWLATRPSENPPDETGSPRLPRQEEGARITVASNGSADVRSLAEALQRAGPGNTIVVEDGAVYQESLKIDDEKKWRDIQIVSPRGATIAPLEQSYAAVVISDTPGVHLSGFRVAPQQNQHAVMITGRCPGVTISELRIDQPSVWAQIFVSGVQQVHRSSL